MHTYKPVHPTGFVVGYYILERDADDDSMVPPVHKFVRLGFLLEEESAMRRVAYLNGDCGELRWQQGPRGAASLWDDLL